MKRCVPLLALVLALLLLLALPACKKAETPRGDVIPAHATYTFRELRNLSHSSDANADVQRLVDRFFEDHVVRVTTPNGTEMLRDFVECVDGEVMLVHYVGEGDFVEQDGVLVFENYTCEREVIGSYARRDMTLTRPLLESGYVKDGELILSVLEPAVDGAYTYELVFTAD